MKETRSEANAAGQVFKICLDIVMRKLTESEAL